MKKVYKLEQKIANQVEKLGTLSHDLQTEDQDKLKKLNKLSDKIYDASSKITRLASDLGAELTVLLDKEAADKEAKKVKKGK